MHIAQNWRLRGIRYAMNAVRCEKCGTVLFPARPLCPDCEQTARPVPYTFNTTLAPDFTPMQASAQYEQRAAR